MIEVIENSIQLAALTVCTVIATICATREKSKRSALLAMFYGSYVLGDLYWLLYLVCYGHTPTFFYVPYLGWYAAYTFLHLLLLRLSPKEERNFRTPFAWAGPVFAVFMCTYYMTFGAYLGNTVTALLMSLLLYHTIRGLIYLHKHPGEDNRRRWIYLAAFVFCVIEYAAWTCSCFFWDESIRNPYYWFDLLVTPCTVMFLPAFRKAVRE